MGFLCTSPLSARPCWLHRLPVRLHKVYHNVIIFKIFKGFDDVKPTDFFTMSSTGL